MKRDMEELKKDVDAAKVSGHRTITDSLHDTSSVPKQHMSKSNL